MLEHELYGADYVEHMIPLPPEVKAYADDILLKVRAAEALKSSEKFKQIKNICKRSICCRISDILRGKSGDTESTKKEESNDVKSRGDSRIVEGVRSRQCCSHVCHEKSNFYNHKSFHTL
jgi:hypothetical protein